MRAATHLPAATACPLRGLALAAALLLAACSNGGPQLLELTGTTMGTRYSVKIVEPPAELHGETLATAVTAELDGLVNRMSTYEPESELTRFNRSRETDWVSASRELVEVIAEARRVSELTGGAFDITVGPLVDLWGFGPVMTDDRIPSDAEIDALRAHLGYAGLEVREKPPALRKRDPDIHVDLSAIAKGYAVDRVASLLEAHGIANYLVEIGGELRGRGRNPAGERWRVGIENPLSGERSVHAIIGIDAIGVATSGDYRNYFERNGQRYSHTIDPRTGRPVAHTLASVTVISPLTMRADALATALLVLGPDDGYALADREGLAALFVLRTADGLVDRQTAAFGRHRIDRST
jgi:thiamine biosynthesis lipoprotein